MALEFQDRVRIAYKKLKASVYFDKTQLPLRDQLVIYESEGIENQLRTLAQKLTGYAAKNVVHTFLGAP